MRDEKNFYNDKKVKTGCGVGLETKHVLKVRVFQKNEWPEVTVFIRIKYLI